MAGCIAEPAWLHRILRGCSCLVSYLNCLFYTQADLTLSQLFLLFSPSLTFCLCCARAYKASKQYKATLSSTELAKNLDATFVCCPSVLDYTLGQ